MAATLAGGRRRAIWSNDQERITRAGRRFGQMTKSPVADVLAAAEATGEEGGRGKKTARPTVLDQMTPDWMRRRGVRVAALSAGGLLLLVVLWASWVALTCPPVERLHDYRPPQASMVFDREGKLLSRLAPEERVVVPLSAISPKLIGALLAVEDQRFYQHRGIDWRRVLGAFISDLRAHSLREGSSTITMQLARNVFPDRLTRARTPRRKLAEMIVARRIERAFDKQQILQMYLNQIYLGNGYYGVEAAAPGYFGPAAKGPSVAQAALLAPLPKAPSSYDPRRFPDAAGQRRHPGLCQITKLKLIVANAWPAARQGK